MIRTVVEVSGTTAFKPFPKSAAGRRTVPIPAWLVPLLRDHIERFGLGEQRPRVPQRRREAASPDAVPFASVAPALVVLPISSSVCRGSRRWGR